MAGKVCDDFCCGDRSACPYFKNFGKCNPDCPFILCTMCQNQGMGCVHIIARVTGSEFINKEFDALFD